MMEWIHILEGGLSEVVSLGQFILEAISVFCVFFGIVKTVQLALRFAEFQYDEFLFIQLRIRFGVWLALALEFQLGADVLATTIAPKTETLIKLGAIAIIRTLLNYFLNMELEHEFEFRKHQSDKENLPSIKQ
ncbi:MAG: DUF1622 domain-containing protein [Sodalinema sp.]|uniref:DUF1622 domain-containing protein n=1 Tax=Sodalinema sp. TaxID=3080550 RepID=UPI00396F6122